jgi:hypothetical protein
MLVLGSLLLLGPATGSSSGTIGHGLGVAPAMIIVKVKIKHKFTGWPVYTKVGWC